MDVIHFGDVTVWTAVTSGSSIWFYNITQLIDNQPFLIIFLRFFTKNDLLS